jgi:hypothetical protein
MFDVLLKKLRNRGLTEPVAQGEEGVRVFLHYVDEPPEGSREQKAAFFSRYFSELAIQLKKDGVSVDPKTISTLGQLVEAVVPANRYDSVERKLKQKHIQMMVDSPRQAAL